jgi:heme/copper-type cytochrome/quinol oxidase subunit 4
MKILEKIPNWLRWILFIPAAFLALLISYPIITILNRITIFGFFGENDFLVEIGILILANFWSAVAFIWVGSIVAPPNNFVVSIVLAGIYSFILGISFFARLSMDESSSVSWLEMIITVVTGIIASVGTVRYFYEKTISNTYEIKDYSEMF